MAFLHIEYLILEDLRGHLIFFIKLQKKENAMADTDFRPGRLGTYSLQFKGAGGQNFFGPFNVFPVGYYVKKSHELTQKQNDLLNINEEKKICLCYKFRDQSDAIYISPLFESCDTKEYGYEPNSRTKIITKLPVTVAMAAVIVTKNNTTIRNLMSECLNDFTFLQNDKQSKQYNELRKRQESYLYTENDESDVILKHVLRNHYFIPENMMHIYKPKFKKMLKTKKYQEFSEYFFTTVVKRKVAFELIDANECVKLMVNLKNAKKGQKNYIEYDGMLFPNPEIKSPKKRKRNNGKKNDTIGSSSKKQKKAVSQDSVEEEQRKKDDDMSDGEDFPDILFMSDGEDFPDTVSVKESLVDAMQKLLNSFSDSDDE